MRRSSSIAVIGALLAIAAPDATHAQGATSRGAAPKSGSSKSGSSKSGSSTSGASTPPARAAVAEPLADSALTAATMRRLQLVAYPARGQTATQGVLDDRACTAWGAERTGVDPAALAEHDARAAGDSARRATRSQSGGAVTGAARGAVVGTAVGAISGNAGKGAGYGAVGGAVQGSRSRGRAGQRAGEQASAAADSAWVRRADHLKRAISTCLTSRGYAVR